MKKVFFIITISILMIACKDQKDPDVKTVTVKEAEIKANNDLAAHYTKAEFSIEGMNCAMGCAAVIEKNLAAMEGVKTAKVNFEEKFATVEYDNSRLDVHDLALTVANTGDGETYKVADMKAAGDKTQEKKCDENCDKACCATKKTE